MQCGADNWNEGRGEGQSQMATKSIIMRRGLTFAQNRKFLKLK
jgi:hypothetical protein